MRATITTKQASLLMRATKISDARWLGTSIPKTGDGSAFNIIAAIAAWADEQENEGKKNIAVLLVRNHFPDFDPDNLTPVKPRAGRPPRRPGKPTPPKPQPEVTPEPTPEQAPEDKPEVLPEVPTPTSELETVLGLLSEKARALIQATSTEAIAPAIAAV